MITSLFPVLDNAYSCLPERFYRSVVPTPVHKPELALWNSVLADELGFTNGETKDSIAVILSGNKVPNGSKPLAMAYAGHQFGQFVPQLGDGRAILLGEVLDSNGKKKDVQLKGAGVTPFSRRGDGRCCLGPAIREYLASEAMHALGIPTTRALAVTLTGERVYRERPLPGAVLTRIANGHIRVGTFQYFLARNDINGIKVLADYVIDRYFPNITDSKERYKTFFLTVRDAQAALIAQWMQVGFIHGVMNTDNTSVLGETIDYGPCAFLDTYDPATAYSYIDHHGRYAFGNQPHIAAWNLGRFAETILELIDPDLQKAVAWAEEVLQDFNSVFRSKWLQGMLAKIGLKTHLPEDHKLVEELLDAMHKAKADYTLTFRQLAKSVDNTNSDNKVIKLFTEPSYIRAWLPKWRARIGCENQELSDIAKNMLKVNPAFILRNHRVERAIEMAVEKGDFSMALELHSVLSKPFDDQPNYATYSEAPRPGDWQCKTFCGT